MRRLFWSDIGDAVPLRVQIGLYDVGNIWEGVKTLSVIDCDHCRCNRTKQRMAKTLVSSSTNVGNKLSKQRWRSYRVSIKTRLITHFNWRTNYCPQYYVSHEFVSNFLVVKSASWTYQKFLEINTYRICFNAHEFVNEIP